MNKCISERLVAMPEYVAQCCPVLCLVHLRRICICLWPHIVFSIAFEFALVCVVVYFFLYLYLYLFLFLLDPSPIICYPCQWLTQLTDSCLVNLINVTLACEDTYSKLVEVVTVLMLMMRIMLATVCCSFGNWGLVIKLSFWSDFEQKV